MQISRDALEDLLQEYEEQVVGLKSYMKELTAQVEKHETEETHFETDLQEAEHNIQYYEAEIARIKKELRGGITLPRPVKQGIGFFVSSAIGFIAGVALGSMLNSKKGQGRGGVR